ncbi:hypothetical protein KFE25_006941 [Diacronema lutheri]|uniref:Exostosin GT47 domain-containing protein n=2 Tax=Diacronema lutheri TaxID=2081491 RepID=A0A8J6CCT1_DIALT|nr:hypothetical protein KFE25_006941 [Diacronema lutheri]
MRVVLAVVALARASGQQAPADDAVYLPPIRADPTAWRLYVHEVPWALLNISSDARRLYEQMIAEEPPPAHDEGGLYHAVVHDLPRLMPRWLPNAVELEAALAATAGGAAPAADVARFGDNVLFLLPLSPYHLCKAVEHPHEAWGSAWAAKKGSIPTSISESMRSALRDGLASYRITCETYERALRWLFSTAAWRLCPERHVFTHMLTHALREALRTDLRRQAHGLGQARGSRALAASATPPARPSGTYARMGAGILVSAEDRRYDWLEARACGHVVPAPYYSPPFFLRGTAPFAPSAAGLPAPGARRALIVESGPRSTACHRFDNRATPNRWACHGAELRYSRFVRMAAKSAMLDVARAAGERVEAHATQRTDKGYAELDGLLRAKAAMYAASTFCLVLAGDSVITTRIFSVVQSLCVPVFVFDRDFLPFGELIPWKNISLRVRGDELILFDRHRGSARNPLLALHALVTERPEELRALQEGVERARWHLTYHRHGRGVAIAGAENRPSAGEALVHHLVQAGAVRQALARVTGGDASSVLRCTDERLRRLDRNDKQRAMQLLLPWPRVQKRVSATRSSARAQSSRAGPE